PADCPNCPSAMPHRGAAPETERRGCLVMRRSASGPAASRCMLRPARLTLELDAGVYMNEEILKRLESIEHDIAAIKNGERVRQLTDKLGDLDAQKRAHQDIIVSLHAAPFEKATGYMNVITLAGYAGCFALWTVIQGDLSRHRNAWIALFLGTSLVAFVVFEVYKMAASAIAMRHIYRLVRSTAPPADYLEIKDKLTFAQRLTQISEYPIWVTSLTVSTSTGIIAAIILFWNYVRIVLG
ncbi:hypothetical protein LGR54_21455, partial [Ancylobacter sp. Lp-2]|uniref:hypothetical protein n=1 Tax=Ancylobacter sp. Lp-2 TaxID=2881339 RepID=UPI001E39E824